MNDTIARSTSTTWQPKHDSCLSVRIRMASLRAFPIASDVPSTGQKSALMAETVVPGYRLATDGSAFVDAFLGTSAWSPPT